MHIELLGPLWALRAAAGRTDGCHMKYRVFVITKYDSHGPNTFASVFVSEPNTFPVTTTGYPNLDVGHNTHKWL